MASDLSLLTVFVKCGARVSWPSSVDQGRKPEAVAPANGEGEAAQLSGQQSISIYSYKGLLLQEKRVCEVTSDSRSEPR